MIDPIVEEIHKIRKEFAEKFDYNVDAMFEDLRKKQIESNRKIVSFAKRTKKRQNIRNELLKSNFQFIF
jgi:Zn-dependent M16 (insulinase) family peptidase